MGAADPPEVAVALRGTPRQRFGVHIPIISLAETLRALTRFSTLVTPLGRHRSDHAVYPDALARSAPWGYVTGS